MASVLSQLVEEVTAHAQSDSLEDSRELCRDGAYFPNNLRIFSSRLRSKDTEIKICLTVMLPVVLHRPETLFMKGSEEHRQGFFDVLLTVHLSIFISVINQLDAQTYCKTKILCIKLVNY